MSTLDHSPLPVSVSDLPTLAHLVHSSKLSLTINRLLFKDWPNDFAQKSLYAQAVESGYKDPSADSLKMVDEGFGNIVGYLIVTRKRPASTEQATGDEEEDQVREQKMSEAFDPDVYKAVGKAVMEIAEEMKGIDHFEITYICVEQSSRRRGIGSQLLQIYIDKAKAEGVPIAVSSEPAAYDFFAKLGFRDMKHADIDLSKWAPAYSGFGLFRLIRMVWSARSPNS